MLIINKYKQFIICSSIYLISVFIVSPWGNYGIGDDIYYLIQLKGFNEGLYIKNAHIDTSLILQILLGQIWAYFFDISFLNMRILTILFTIGLIFVLVKIFDEIKISKKFSYVGIFLIIFNVKLFHYSLSYNTEIYFIFFMLLSTYFLVKFEKLLNFKYYYLAMLFAGLSVCIRQVGVLLIFPLLFILFYKFNRERIKNNIIKIIFGFLIFILFSLIGIFWPKEVSLFQENSKTLLGIIDVSRIFEKFKLFWFEIPYLSVTLIPFSLQIYKSISSLKYKIFLNFIVLLFSINFFYNNIFSIGNLFYIEGISASSYTRIREHTLNNIPFKFFISILIGFTFCSFIYFLICKLKKINFDSIILILLINFATFYSSILLADVPYDRYFLFAEVFFVILFIKLVFDLNLNLHFYNLFLLSLLIIATILYTFDYHQLIKNKWEIADRIAFSQGIIREKIFVNDNYLKFNYIDRQKDFKGLKAVKPNNHLYSCFVITQENSSGNFLRLVIERITIYFQKLNFLPIQKVNNSFTAGQVKSCSSCDVLLQKNLTSPLYSLYGKSVSLKAYCLDKKK